MTDGEIDARRFLKYCKAHAKEAMAALDPAPTEPVAMAILALIDAVDVASKALEERMP